jgi:hypothetical protein
MKQTFVLIFAVFALGAGTVQELGSRLARADEGLPEDATLNDAGQWTCGNPSWVGNPGMQPTGFVGVQEGTCTVQLSRDGSISALDQHFRDGIKDSKIVHAGPVDETFQGLPGVLYDVTVEVTDGAFVTIRQDVHIASDRTTQVIYATVSKSVAASGMAGYLRKLEIGMEITQGDAPGKYNVKLTNGITVAKPWYAPTGIFVSKAKEQAVNQFLKFRATSLPDILAHL